MAIYKGKIRQKKTDGTYDYLLPETTIDQVYDSTNNKPLNETLNDLKHSNFLSDGIADIPLLDLGKPAISSDTKQVFIGTGTENIELAHQPQVDTLDIRVDHLGINVMHYGVKGDGSDETAKIQTLLDAHDHIFFPTPPRHYGIGSTLIIGRGRTRYNRQTITFAPNAKLKPTRDIDMVRLINYGVTVRGLVIDVTALGQAFTKAGIVLYSDDADNPCVENTVEYTFIQETNVKTGIGIQCITEGEGYIYYNKIHGHIRSGRYGILIENGSEDGINSNTFDLDLNSSLQLIKMYGASGNVFRGRGQATWTMGYIPPDVVDVNDLACIVVDNCEHNQFEIFIYDVGRPNVMQYSYEFLGDCRANTYVTGAQHLKGVSHYSNEVVSKYQVNHQQKHKITNRFAGARQKQLQGFGYHSTPDDFRHSYDDYLMISPETNSLADLRNIQTMTITPTNCTLTVGDATNPMTLFNHNARSFLRYVPTNVTLPSSVRVDIALKTSEVIHALGLVKEYIRSGKVRAKAFISTNGTTYTELPSVFGAQIYEDGADQLEYNDKNKYDYGSDVIFAPNEARADIYDVTHIRFELSLPGLSPTVGTLPIVNGEYIELYYLWVNCAARKSTRVNNAYPYIGGDKFTGNISFSGGASVVLIDEYGASHKLIVSTDGALSTEPLGYI